VEEQEFQDMPEEDLEDDIEELLQQNGETKSGKLLEPDFSSKSDSESESESADDEEPGMKLRSGKLKTEPTLKTVRFRSQ
jgi:hypothetical protein